MIRFILSRTDVSQGSRNFSALLRRSMASGFLLSFAIFMSVLAMLAAALGLAGQSWGQSWSDALSQGVTIEIRDTSTDKSAEPAVRTLMNDLKRQGHLIRADIVTSGQLGAMLKPWLGAVDDSTLDHLPLPILIDGELPDDHNGTLAVLNESVAAWSAGTGHAAHVTRHQEWLGDVQIFIAVASLGGWGICFAILALSALATAVIVQAQIVSHREDIAILTILGATDGFIAAQFRSAIGWICAQAVVISCLVVGACAFLFSFALSPATLTEMGHMLGLFAAFAVAAGIFLTLLSVLAAHLTVHHELRGQGHVRL